MSMILTRSRLRRSLAGATLIVAAFVHVVSAAAATAPPLDLIVRGGTIMDGTGADGYPADVGIRDGRIVSIGKLDSVAARDVLDATGLIVAPGFIDAHNHVPDAILELRDAAPIAAAGKKASRAIVNEAYLTQGVTTIVGGPDGLFAPASIRAVIAHFERDGIATNYAFYVGHNGVRRAVMGRAQREPTRAELDAMQALVREGMEIGAVGLSTGLMYEPGMFSKTAEVVELARAVRPYGGTYDSHTRDPVFDLIASDEEVIEVGRLAGIAAKIAHIKPVGLLNKGRAKAEIALVEAARAQGQDVVADQYPYDGAAVATLDRIIVVPGARELDLAGVRKALADESRHAQIRKASEQGIAGGFSWIKAAGYGGMRILDAPDRPELVGRNIELLAQERKQQPFDLVVELLLDHPRPILLTLGALEESDLRAELAMPWNMIASDGQYVDPRLSRSYHPRSTGTFTRVLGHYVRNVKLFSLPEAIRKMTSFPADHLNLSDRGRIRVGCSADVTVFDAANVRDRSTWTDPTALSEGIVHVVVNGIPALRNRKITGATPGQLVKRQLSHACEAQNEGKDAA